MRDEILLRDVSRELIDLLGYFDSIIVSKIPNKVVDTFQKYAKKSTKTFTFDASMDLQVQIRYDETKNILAMIYYTYFLGKSDRDSLFQRWQENNV